MREIKFRIWNKYDKYFLSEIESRLFTLDDMKYDDPHVFSQFTGLKDKNGVEIYEGDIVLISGVEKHEGFRELSEKGVITYSLCASFDILNEKGVHYSFGYCPIEEIEIIGNIYENKEQLIKKATE